MLRGDGSISKRGDAWQLRQVVALEDGSTKVKTRLVHGSKSDARAAMESFRAELSATLTPMDFPSYAAAWNDRRLRIGAIRPATHVKNASLIALAARSLAGVPMATVTTGHLEEMTLDASRTNSKTRLSMLQTLVCQVWRHAVSHGDARHDPTAAWERIRPDKARRECVGDSEFRHLMEDAPIGDYHYMALRLMGLAGLRPQEALSLEWSDVAADFKSIRVRGTKTAASDATVPIVDDLSRHLAAFRATRLHMDGLVCCALDGKPFPRHSLDLWWRRHRSEWDMDGFRLYDLRHAFCTHMAEADIHPAVMQRMMRHSDSRTCMEVYTHVRMDALQDAVQLLSKSGQ